MALFRKKPDVDPEDAQRFASELRTVEAVLRQYPRTGSISFGAPTRCPDCGDYGFVVNVNRGLAMCSNRCLACGMQWTITARALTHALSQPRPDAMPAVATIGTLHDNGTLHTADRDFDSTTSSTVDAGTAAHPSRLTVQGGPQTTVNVPAAPAEPAIAEPKPEPAAVPVPVLNLTSVPPPTDTGDRSMRLLVVEGNPFDFAVVETIIDADPGQRIELVSAATLGEGYEHAAMRIDAVLLTLDLPDSPDPVTTILEWQHNTDANIPLLVVTDTADRELIAQARALGVAHVVQKQQLADLADDPEKGCTRFVHLLTSTIRKHEQNRRQLSTVA